MDKMKKFLQPHSFKYDALLMNNGKYLVWKLMFSRVDDTFVTIDKMLDIMTWEVLYKLMETITAGFDSWVNDPSNGSYMRYKIQIRRVNLDHAYQQCLFDVNTQLLYSECMMCMEVSLNNDSIVEQFALIRTSSDMIPTNSKISSDAISAEIVVPSEVENNSMFRKRQHSVSSNESDTLTKILEIGLTGFTKSESDMDIVDESDLTYGGFQIPKNLIELAEQMTDNSIMTRFGYDETNNRFFDKVYSVNDGRHSYAAFHNLLIIGNMRRQTHLKLFFSFSPELFDKFGGFDVRFVGISHILIVYVKLFNDQVFPFGYFLLENTGRLLFEDVVRVIDQWLQKESDTGKAYSPIISKCVVPHNRELHRSISKYWPNTQLIGCSTQFQREICDFIQKKRTPTTNRDIFLRDKKKLICFARAICYLPQEFIPTGIDVIEQVNVSDERLINCKIQLVETLQSTWKNQPISVYNEKVVYRTLNICTQFNLRIKREFKQDNEHIWKSIEMLKALNERVELEFRQSLTKVQIGFGLNTPHQKKAEVNYWTAIKLFQQDLKVMQPMEAVKRYMEHFLNNLE